MTTAPENEKGRPGTRAANSETDLLAGDHLDHIAISDLASAEQVVVEACIRAQVPTRHRVHSFMRNDDLSDPVCRLLDAAMRKMDAARVPVDPATLAGYIEQHQLTLGLTLRHIRSTIAALADGTAIPAHAIYYAGLVVQASCRRELLSVAAEIKRLAELASIDELQEAVGAQGRRATTAIARALAVAE